MTGRLVLWRMRPPFVKVVRVRQVTVDGFMRVLERLYERLVAATKANGGKAIPEERFPSIFTAQDYLDFADLVCAGQRPGFLYAWLGRYAWLNQRNLEALLAASREAEGKGQWHAMFDLMRQPTGGGESDARRSGGLPALVAGVCAHYRLDPRVVFYEWPMQQFIGVCRTLQLIAAQDERSPRKGPTVLPLSAFSKFTTGRVH